MIFFYRTKRKKWGKEEYVNWDPDPLIYSSPAHLQLDITIITPNPSLTLISYHNNYSKSFHATYKEIYPFEKILNFPI